MSNLKVLLNRKWWVPGEEISGYFIVETAEGFKVERIAIHLKCLLTTKILNKRPEVEKWQEYDDIFSKSPYSQELYKHYGIELADINLAPSGIFRNPSDAWKEGKIDRDVISREEEIVLYSETLDRHIGFDNCGFPTGTTTVPFSVTPKCDFSSLIQSGDLKSRGGTTIIGANYYLEIDIHYPVSFFNIVTMAWKEFAPLTVLHASTVPDPLQTTEYVSEYLVYLWEKESYGFGQMLKYAVGKDTSSVQFPMKLILQVPSMVQLHYGQPVYLSDVLKLKTVYNPIKQIQLVPAMELTGLKASIVTMMTKRIHKLEKIKNSKQSQESTYQELETVIGEIKHTKVNLNAERGEDLTTLLNGIQIPPDAMSSCVLPDIQIYNFIYVTVKVKVKSSETDGTKQVSQHGKVAGLLNIQRVAPLNSTTKSLIISGLNS